MKSRWLLPGLAAGAVALVAAGTAIGLGGRGGAPAGSAAPPTASTDTPAGSAAPPTGSTPAPVRALDQLRVRNGDLVTASGTVLVTPGRPVRFCAPVPVAAIGHLGPERPPGCSLGVDLVGADAGRLTGAKTFGGTRWGQAGITGRYADGTVTVTAQGAPVAQPDPATGLPDGTPCPAPVGGWRPGPLGAGGPDAVTSLVQGRPTAYGEVVMTYPDGPPAGPTAAPEYTDATEVLMVTTTLPLAEAERELRVHFSGNLCVRPAVRSRSATDAVWTRINPSDGKAWRRHHVYEGWPDYLAGQVRIVLVVLDDDAYGWLTGAAAGTPSVDAEPWLRPAG